MSPSRPVLAAPLALDHPTWTSLTGAHARLARIKGQAACYPSDMSPFAALAPGAEPEAWDDLAALIGPGAVVALAGDDLSPPAGWEVVAKGQGLQLEGSALQVEEDAEAVPLEPSDVADMLALVEQTKPGPFLPRTIEMGNYLGIRRSGVLIAMAGERLHPPGWTEISAVCTAADFRGQGLATRLVRAVGAGVRSRGETPFLHCAANNTNAIRLYQSLGFTIRREIIFQGVRPIADRDAR